MSKHNLVEDEWVKLNTQHPEDSTECSPTAEYQNGQWYISFIARGAESDRLFRLYKYVDGVVTMEKEPAYECNCSSSASCQYSDPFDFNLFILTLDTYISLIGEWNE